MKTKMKPLLSMLIVASFTLSNHASGPSDPLESWSVPGSVCRSGDFPSLSFDGSQIFPKDKTLLHPEDGRALPDGRIIVGDEELGLRIIEKDGSSRGFGRFKEAGWVHDPPRVTAGPNGMFLESDGRHLLLADVYNGRIYRVDTGTEDVKLIYSHPFGINSVIRDSIGTIWFTQSAKNIPERGFQDLFAAVDRPVASGAVFYLRGSGNNVELPAVEAASDIYFANGIALDEDEKYLYVAETMMDRVLRFEIDVAKGALSNRETYQYVITPDNLAFDKHGNLYAASPISNSVIAVDKKCRSVHTVFSAPSGSNSKAQDKWTENSRLGKPLLELFTPEVWNPLPGGLTGMFWSRDQKTLYVTGLGSAILKVDLGTGGK
ncbi:MAG: SMP-30/gluconolactonase/LRE family protein [Aridibacter famidurans]|nr:SMP-30/gluconolactonase/LRE family protein [Aridibacter famidurans]